MESAEESGLIAMAAMYFHLVSLRGLIAAQKECVGNKLADMLMIRLRKELPKLLQELEGCTISEDLVEYLKENRCI